MAAEFSHVNLVPSRVKPASNSTERPPQAVLAQLHVMDLRAARRETSANDEMLRIAILETHSTTKKLGTNYGQAVQVCYWKTVN